MRRKRSKVKEGIILAIQIAAVAFLFHAAVTVGLPPKSTPIEYITYTVQPGDTLWTIADNIANDTSERQIRAIQNENSLFNSVIMPGRKLSIPVRTK